MSSEANPIETATLTELIEMGEKALEVRCGDAFSATDPLDGEWIPEIQRYLNKAGDAAVPLAREVMRLREENETLRKKYVRCIGCGGPDPIEEGTYCLRCVQEGDRSAQ